MLLGAAGGVGKYVGDHGTAAVWHHHHDRPSTAVQVFEALARAAGRLGCPRTA
ncbi:hypothetical protein [Streptomyces carpinensis]|uniref:Uncharacterized protein n=1 Tax=Streptomyces carpinensis TaxID=66369 RepID=A0ABV1WHL4_9ACTN|nr:hypothetical protein [Streptomyces carpinensis]